MSAEMDYQAWRCCHDDSKMCPDEGCSKADGCARDDKWLIIKRDLYYRPEARGYTGIRDEAGRYSYDEAVSRIHPGVTIVREKHAPEFTRACFEDYKSNHLIAQRDALRNQLEAYGIGPPDNGVGGMSLRDWFAGQALAGTLAFPIPGGEKKPENAARYAYEYADAMLAERKRNLENT